MTKKKIIGYIKKNWAVIGFLISFVLDSQYGILEKLFNNDMFWVKIVQGLGVFVVAYFTQSKLGLFSKDVEIGGGGIHNPPKP